MTEKSFFWNGTSLGDAATWTPAKGYHMANADYESPWVDIMMRAILNGTGNQGVLLGWLNELEVTGVASPLAVNDGAAIIYGLYYENDASRPVVVDTPTSDVRVDRLVIRRDWAAQTARITLLGGVEGAGAAPGMTQSPAPSGSGVYDIPLATIEITTGGVITVTDAREFCEFSLEPADGAFGTDHLVNESVDLAARATRTKKFFLSGGDLEPSILNSRFSQSSSVYITNSVVTTWGATAASVKGWKIDGGGISGAYAVFKVPSDWAGGDVTLYTWWIDDCGNEIGFTIYTLCQLFRSGLGATYQYTFATVHDTYSVDYPVRTNVITLTDLVGDELIYICDALVGVTGPAESVLLVGIEVEYTGYL